MPDAAPLGPQVASVPAIMSKSEFAKRRRVDPSAVSHWIRTGKLTERSLDGVGRYAKIRVAEAEAELGLTLDPGQQLAHGKPRPVGAAVAPGGAGGSLPGLEPPAPASGGGASDDQAEDPQERYQRARADKAEHELELSRRRMKEQDGLYTLTGQARAAFSRSFTEFLRDLEAWLPDLSAALAAKSGADRALLLVELRGQFRMFRARQAERAAKAAQALPLLVVAPEDEDEDEGEHVA